jgi:hypothetical protein
MTRWVSGAVVVAAALALAGCAGSGRPGPAAARRQPAIPAQALRVICPGADGAAGRHAAAQPAQPVPARFTPVAAVRYSPAFVPANDLGSRVAPVKEVAVSGLGRLVAALHSRPARLPPGTVCAAQSVYIEWFVLVGKNGQVIRPDIPLGNCGEPSAAVVSSLDALDWVTATTR